MSKAGKGEYRKFLTNYPQHATGDSCPNNGGSSLKNGNSEENLCLACSRMTEAVAGNPDTAGSSPDYTTEQWFNQASSFSRRARWPSPLYSGFLFPLKLAHQHAIR